LVHPEFHALYRGESHGNDVDGLGLTGWDELARSGVCDVDQRSWEREPRVHRELLVLLVLTTRMIPPVKIGLPFLLIRVPPQR
jgi:hypothetical protein